MTRGAARLPLEGRTRADRGRDGLPEGGEGGIGATTAEYLHGPDAEDVCVCVARGVGGGCAIRL